MMIAATEPSPECLTNWHQPMEKAGERQSGGCTRGPASQMPPPPNLLSPSHCLEIDHELTARRQPSYGVLTVLSCPLVERRWRSSSALSSTTTPLCTPGGERAGTTSAAVAEDLEQWRN